jgi:hypothetical protein
MRRSARSRCGDLRGHDGAVRASGSTANKIRIWGVSWIMTTRCTTLRSARSGRARRFAVAPVSPLPARPHYLHDRAARGRRCRAPAGGISTNVTCGGWLSVRARRLSPAPRGPRVQRAVAPPQRLGRRLHAVLPRQLRCRCPEHLGIAERFVRVRRQPSTCVRRGGEQAGLPKTPVVAGGPAHATRGAAAAHARLPEDHEPWT